MNSEEESGKKQEMWIEEYLAQLNDKQRKAYEIAKDHLKTSFSMKKSIGFQEWYKARELEKKNNL